MLRRNSGQKNGQKKRIMDGHKFITSKRLTAVILASGLFAVSGCGIVSDEGIPFTKPNVQIEQVVGSMEEAPVLEYEMPEMTPSIVIGEGGFSELEVKYAWIKCREVPELFMVRDTLTGENVYIGRPEEVKPLEGSEGYKAKILFAPVSEDGTYYITADGLGCSYEFTVSSSLYEDRYWEFLEKECEKCRSGEASSEEVYMCLYAYERYREVLFEITENAPDVMGAVGQWIASADFDGATGEDHFLKMAILAKYGHNLIKKDEKSALESLQKSAALFVKNEPAFDDDTKKSAFLAYTELYRSTGQNEYSKKILDMQAFLSGCENLHDSKYVLYGSMAYMTTKYWVDRSLCDMLISKLLYRARDIGDDKKVTDPEHASYEDTKDFLICAQQLAVMNYVLDGYEYNEIILDLLHYIRGRNFQGNSCDIEEEYPADTIAIYSWIAWLERNGKLDPAAPVVWNYSW